MEEETTIHWHGLLVDSDVDGVFQTIDANSSLEQTLKIRQPASTAWYHPHTMGKTASQVIEGLAGFIIIDDANSESLNLPSEYGVNDIPVVFQRKGFTSDNQISLTKSRNVSIINGAIYPTLNVSNEWVRLRIINGNNDEILELSFSDDSEKYIIATDNGFVEEPIAIDKLTLGSGERVELLVNLTEYETGDQIQIKSSNVDVMKINIDSEVDANYAFKLPDKLTEKTTVSTKGLATRDFSLAMRHMTPTINNQTYDYNRIDEYMELGTQEIWTVRNDDNMMATPHPFHIHGVTFDIIKRNNIEIQPWERGAKDTVLIYPGEEVELLVTYGNKGKFVYHCHFLDHEEAGMMGTFTVE